MLEKEIRLTGQLVQLEPLKENHREILRTLSHDDRTSTYSPGLNLNFDMWFDKALKTFPELEQFTFVVSHLQKKEIIGSTRFYDIYPNHKRLAIGYTWYTPSLWGTGINLDCKLLLLHYSFHVLKMNRVEFHIDARNQRSRSAVKKLGAVEEGILREHAILDDSYIRDTVIYSILGKEWPELSQKLHTQLHLKEQKC